MAAQDKNLNALFLPYFITSHMTPLVHTAVLFASRPGVAVTILTTPSNALMFQPSVDRAASAGHRITFHTLKFPAAEVGLPEGVENYGSIASRDMIPKVTLAISLLREPMEQAIRDLRPDCIVSDVLYPWTVDIAEELNIPRLILSTTNCFSECVYHQLKIHKPYEKVRSDSESFVVPGLPDEIEMTSAQLEDYLKTPEDSGNSGELMNQIEDAETRSYGIVFTSYSEIEPEYVQHSKNVMGRKSWHVGLPSLILGKENETNTNPHRCLNWLDIQKPGSVLYVSFGSLIRFPDTQFTEIALALEELGRPFVWVVRKIGKTGEKEDEDWLPEGFRERVLESNKGLMIREWAPQISILAHPAIGGFMTHCGWNSAMEGMAAGVPLITCPVLAEQFYNEKLITRVLKIGVEVGSGVWNRSPQILSPVVGKDKIVKAVSRLMDGSEEAEEIRRRAKEVSVMMKMSVEEGGSSSSDLNSLIEELKAYVRY
ncbi:scopoletin glucosyltransferase-like [Rhododendron vialii]|uniref:scopoletin glucosyltransferase-like n=1 Tax=Rhododendron vialii TaxID=182163 RepID=UPI00265DCF3F|nr:scopoletin glucosyltransferase-like [Rhododendron vialii]